MLDGEVELRLSDGTRITAFKGKTNARVKDMAVSGGRLYIGGTFKTVNAVARTALAALDPVTGALSADLNLAFTGPRTGTVNVDKFDISPDGSRLVAIGNWTSVAGLRRDQIVMLDLAARPVAVTGWATTRHQQQCAAVFATYMRDIDVSPDGSYFVVVTTGAYRARSPCDAAARWETAATGPGQQPTWVDYAGGDTLYPGRRHRGARVPGRHPAGRPVPPGLDGTMTARSFDGTAAGPATPLAPNGLTSTQFPVNRITGMFFWNGRLYYTLSVDSRLYFRWFTPQSGAVGADTFVASGAGDGRTWSTVTSMTMAPGRLLYATTTGTLSAVDFPNGLPTGTATVVSGPAVDGRTWQSHGLFVLNPAN